MNHLPETILQFGGGRFLRSFVDLFVQQANEAGQAVGRVVVVQSTDSDRARFLNEQQGRYHVLVRGFEEGRQVDRVEPVASISRALTASGQWDEVLAAACSPDVRLIVSNTTEAGLALDPSDQSADAPPRSFPARLLHLLRARFETGQAPPRIVPCELVESAGDRLRDLVLQQAERWRWSGPLAEWLREGCAWTNNLVDRIVARAPSNHPLAESDRLLSVAEPYAFWAVQQKAGQTPLFEHPAITPTEDVLPYHLRKVRILNGAHTALVAKVQPKGDETVRQALEDSQTTAWLEELLFEEVVPVLQGRVEGPEEFARKALERFRNPFIEHRLADIALYHSKKVNLRLAATRDEYVRKFGRRPPRLEEAIAASEGING